MIFFLAILSLFGVTPNLQSLSPSQPPLQSFAVESPMSLSDHLWFRTCSHRRSGVSHCKDHCHIVATVKLAPIVFLQVPLRSSSTNLLSRGNLALIKAFARPHAPPKHSTPQSYATCNLLLVSLLNQTRFVTFDVLFIALNKLHELGLPNSVLPYLAQVALPIIMILSYFFIVLTKALFCFSYMCMI